MQRVSKSAFKTKARTYCREVQEAGEELVITDHGKPVVKVIPYGHDPMAVLQSLRGSVLRYDDPLAPVWSADRSQPASV